MLSFINYLKSLFCSHNYIFEKEISYFDGDKLPVRGKRIYMCHKCGSVKNIKM